MSVIVQTLFYSLVYGFITCVYEKSLMPTCWPAWYCQKLFDGCTLTQLVKLRPVHLLVFHVTV